MNILQDKNMFIIPVCVGVKGRSGPTEIGGDIKSDLQLLKEVEE